MRRFFSRCDRAQGVARERHRRIASLCIAGAAVLAAGCVGSPRRTAPTWERPFLSVRFDSARDLQVVSNLLMLDTAASVVQDVVEVGGRVTGYHGDTLLIEPYYISMYDASRDDRARTFYRGGAYRLPDLAIVESGAGTVISEFMTPAARKSRQLNNILEAPIRIFPILLFLSFIRRIGHW